MKTTNLVQGSPEWKAHRARHFNASDAPAMMGASKYTTRSELLRQMAGGEWEPTSPTLQAIYDRGHAAEAAIRPFIEQEIGDELFPVTGVSDEHPKLSASFDGISMDESTIFEHKLWADNLAESVRRGELDMGYVWQLEQQLLVSGAQRAIFVVSDGTPEKCVQMEYRPVPGRVQQLLAGWAQFERDLADYKPAAVTVEAVGRAPETLPALRIEVTGMVKASNLAEFQERAVAVFQSISTDLQTDQDFANADKTGKWLSEIEAKLKAAKDAALAQTQDIDALFRAIDAIGSEARSKRLELEKLVKARKDAVRFEILNAGRAAMEAYVKIIRATMPDGYMVPSPEMQSDLAAAVKGLRTIQSVQDAVDGVVARAKIDIGDLANSVRQGAALFAEHAEHASLFPDRHALALSKTPDDLRNLIAARIAQQKADEDARAEAQRERIRQEEARKLQAAAVAAAVVAPIPPPASQPVTVQPITPPARQKAVQRPSDAQIIAAVANSFGVALPEAARWMTTFDTKAITKRKAA